MLSRWDFNEPCAAAKLRRSTGSLMPGRLSPAIHASDSACSVNAHGQRNEPAVSRAIELYRYRGVAALRGPLEGAALLLWWSARSFPNAPHGVLTAFFVFYAVFSFREREPDSAMIGLLTKGQFCPSSWSLPASPSWSRPGSWVGRAEVRPDGSRNAPTG
jgi:hypothetical protein